MAEGHNKAEYCSGSHLNESGFRSIDISLALSLSQGRGVRRIVAYNMPTFTLCRSGYTWPQATTKFNIALDHILKRVVSGPKICP